MVVELPLFAQEPTVQYPRQTSPREERGAGGDESNAYFTLVFVLRRRVEIEYHDNIK
jgi:hypothetical protein